MSETTSDEMREINPQITETKIGIRDLRIVTVYPLSLGNQLALEDVITKALTEFNVGDDPSAEEVMGFFFTMIKGNLERIIGFVIEEPDPLNNMTNDQAIEIASIIFEVNYEGSIKNALSLFEKIKTAFQPERQLPQSASDMEDIDLSISLEDDTVKEELPEDN